MILQMLLTIHQIIDLHLKQLESILFMVQFIIIGQGIGEINKEQLFIKMEVYMLNGLMHKMELDLVSMELFILQQQLL